MQPYETDIVTVPIEPVAETEPLNISVLPIIFKNPPSAI